MIINHGVRGSTPNPSHEMSIYGGNTSCVEVRTSKYQLIFDCGSGFSNVNLKNNLQTILFISHFHHDHIQGLAFNQHVLEPDKKIIITSNHSNKNTTYKNLFDYYNIPYFPVNFFDITKNFKFYEFDQVVNDYDDLNIKSINLNHPGNCSGYSITSDKKKFCYLLDNEFEIGQVEELVKFCDNSHTIIWDGAYLDHELINKKGWGHSSVEQGVQFSSQIQVKNFLISHHETNRKDNEIKRMQKKILNGNVKFASENEVIEF